MATFCHRLVGKRLGGTHSCMHTCRNTHIHTHTNIHTYTHIQTYMHTLVDVHTHLLTCTHAHMPLPELYSEPHPTNSSAVAGQCVGTHSTAGLEQSTCAVWFFLAFLGLFSPDLGVSHHHSAPGPDTCFLICSTSLQSRELSVGRQAHCSH